MLSPNRPPIQNQSSPIDRLLPDQNEQDAKNHDSKESGQKLDSFAIKHCICPVN
jgi:hypothetical protein